MKQKRIFSEEHKRKLSIARKRRVITEETKRKMSRSQKNRTHTEETKRKIGEKSKGRTCSEETKRKMSISRKGRCPTEETRRKISKTNKGRCPTEETRRKISKSNKGQIPWLKGKHHSIETRKKLSISHKDKVISEEHKRNISKSNKGRKVSEETKTKLKISLRKSIEQIQEKYPIFSKIEEMRYNPDKSNEKEIQCHCKYHKCPNSKENKGWFTPNNNQFLNRIYALEKDDGNDGMYLYCSEECKQLCPEFNLRSDPLRDQDKNYTDEEYQTCRNHTFELDENKCLYCGENAEHIHHIKPIKLEPFFSLDPDNCISVCKKCHYNYGHKEDCSTGKLASKICDR